MYSITVEQARIPSPFRARCVDFHVRGGLISIVRSYSRPRPPLPARLTRGALP